MTQSLAPASSYTHCNELWCITAYFNPAHYRTRPANHARFAAPLRAAPHLAATILPLACLALALTSAPGSETAWLLIAVVNLVLPAVMLPLVWRGAWRDRGRAARRAIESAGAHDALVTTRS